MKTFNSSSLLLLAVFLLLMRVGGCATSIGSPKEPPHKIQSAVVPSPCEYNSKTDQVRDESQCDVIVGELGQAAADGNIERMKTAIKNGADVNAMRESHYPALFVAVQNGQADAVSFLIEQDADVNARIGVDFTPLKAVPLSRPDIAAILVAHGAKPSL